MPFADTGICKIIVEVQFVKKAKSFCGKEKYLVNIPTVVQTNARHDAHYRVNN